jgi:hypothetical protein
MPSAMVISRSMGGGAVQPDSDALELFAKAWTALVPAFQRREAPTLAPWMEWASEPGPDEPA